MNKIPSSLQTTTEAWVNILNNCVRINRKDKILLITDISTTKLAEAFSYAISAYPNIITPILYPYTLQRRTSKISRFMPIYNLIKSSSVLITAITDAVECTSFRVSLLKIACKNNLKVVHMPGARKEFLTKSTLNVDFRKMNKDANKYANLLSRSQSVTITTRSRLTKEENKLELNLGKRVGHSDGGLARRGKIINIPTGEAFIAPIENSANGSIAINGSFPRCRLGKNDEFILNFKNGVIDLNKSIFPKSTAANECKRILENTKKNYKTELKIGEFGIGVNRGVKKPTGNDILDEKIYGTAHIAIGWNSAFGGRNNDGYHHDMIFFPYQIEMDGKALNIDWMK